MVTDKIYNLKAQRNQTKTQIPFVNFTVMLFLPSVLSDAQSRAIYDIFGKKGLEVEGWEVFKMFMY